MAIADDNLAVAVFAFTVVLDGLDDISDDLANRLFEAGCDGVVSLEFDREAGSLAEAIGTAVPDITTAGCVPAQITLDRESD